MKLNETGTVRIMEARSCNHCCSGKAMNITYVECVFAALGNQHSVRMRHIVVCGLPRSTIFFHIISYYLINGTIFGKKKVIEHKMCVLSFSTTFV